MTVVTRISTPFATRPAAHVVSYTGPVNRAIEIDGFQARFSAKADNPLLASGLSLSAFERQVTKLSARAKSGQKAEAKAQLTEVLDRYLQGQWTDKTHPGKRAVAVSALKQLMGKRGQGNIVLAQINPIPGDLKSNALKILNYFRHAEAIGVDTIVFPESVLMGYPIRDVITRHPYIVDENVKWLEALAKATANSKTRMVLGFVEPRKSQTQAVMVGKNLYNSLAVLGNGKIEGVVRKSLLPNYNEFNDWRNFEASPATGVFPANTLGAAEWGNRTTVKTGTNPKIHGHRYGMAICEDGWNDKEFMTDGYLYHRDPYTEVVSRKPKPEILLNISASPTRMNKEQLKNNMLAFVAQKHGVPYVYVNQVGGIDETVFEGASRVYDKNGNLIARAKSFQEQFLVANPLKAEGKVYPLVEDITLGKRAYHPTDDSDMARIYNTLVLGIRDYFAKRGFTQKAVLGLSGGLDSAVVATLLADALGPENVLGVRMSSKITSGDSEKDAQELADKLGIHLIDLPIREPVAAFANLFDQSRGAVDKAWGKPTWKTTTPENVQARARMIFLYALGNEYNAMPIATSDKSELYMGYTTIGGDMLGELAPIADLLKTQVRTLAKWMNQNRPVKDTIPLNTIAKKPGAELAVDPKTGLPVTAESDLMPYEFLDEVIWRLENQHQSKSQMAAESFWYEQHMQPVSAETKQAWLDKFYRRMPTAFIKWWLAPPTININAGSITKSTYHNTITSSRMQWDGHSSADIQRILSEQAPQV